MHILHILYNSVSWLLIKVGIGQIVCTYIFQNNFLSPSYDDITTFAAVKDWIMTYISRWVCNDSRCLYIGFWKVLFFNFLSSNVSSQLLFVVVAIKNPLLPCSGLLDIPLILQDNSILSYIELECGAQPYGLDYEASYKLSFVLRNKHISLNCLYWLYQLFPC